MPCPHVTGVRYHVYRIEIIELVADISDLKYPLFVSQERKKCFQSCKIYNETGWHHDRESSLASIRKRLPGTFFIEKIVFANRIPQKGDRI